METKPFDDLKANPKNPRRISDHDFNALKTSLAEFGDLSGIVFNLTTKQLVGGHQRIEAFRRLSGQKQVVITERYKEPDKVGTVAYGWITHNNQFFAYREVVWPAERETAANIAANRIEGEFDLDLLAEANYQLHEEFPDLLPLTGQRQSEIDDLLDAVGAKGEDNSADDEVPAVDSAPPVSKAGEIYQLGEHRLMCGDATDYGAVTDLLDGAKVGMVFTDPPYNAAFNGRSGNHEVIANDDLPPEKWQELMAGFIEIMYTVAEDAPKYICTDWRCYPAIYSLLHKPAACIVWVKNMFGMGNGYRHQHELIAFEGSLQANDKSDVWEIKRDNGQDYDHPTQKPVAVPSEALINSSKRDDVVLDFFGGSGSTLIACQKLGRKAYILELDNKYVDVIIKRWMKYTGQRAVRIRDAAGNQVSEPVQFADESFMQ